MDWYLFLKALHIVSWASWMAALLYFPRLLINLLETPTNQTHTQDVLMGMAYRLQRIIMTPAMLATWVLGIALIVLSPGILFDTWWLPFKIVLILGLSGFHGMLISERRKIAAGKPSYSTRRWRLLNEVPTVIMFLAVFLAIFKPS